MDVSPLRHYVANKPQTVVEGQGLLTAGHTTFFHFLFLLTFFFLMYEILVTFSVYIKHHYLFIFSTNLLCMFPCESSGTISIIQFTPTMVQ